MKEQIYNKVRHFVSYWLESGQITIQEVIKNLQEMDKEYQKDKKQKVDKPEETTEE